MISSLVKLIKGVIILTFCPLIPDLVARFAVFSNDEIYSGRQSG